MRNWDKFYKRNGDHFFKDRHYLAQEWPQLKSGAADGAAGGSAAEGGEEAEDGDDAAAEDEELANAANDELTAALQGGSGGATSERLFLEAGCGVGNTLFPLLRANPLLRCYACDFSPAAIEIVKQHPLTKSGRVTAAVGDLTSGELPPELSECIGKCEVATLMFVLSAISPGLMMANAINAALSGLADGGLLLIRDYANGDGAQQRLRNSSSSNRPKQLDEHGRFFVRQDGTRAYYFEVDELSHLVEEASGGRFETLRCDVRERTTVNRVKGVSINRRFLTATFRKRKAGDEVKPRPRGAPPPAAAEATASQQATTAASPAAAAEDASEWAAKKERMRQELMSCVGNDASQQRRMLKELSDELCE